MWWRCALMQSEGIQWRASLSDICVVHSYFTSVTLDGHLNTSMNEERMKYLWLMNITHVSWKTTTAFVEHELWVTRFLVATVSVSVQNTSDLFQILKNVFNLIETFLYQTFQRLFAESLNLWKTDSLACLLFIMGSMKGVNHSSLDPLFSAVSFFQVDPWEHPHTALWWWAVSSVWNWKHVNFTDWISWALIPSWRSSMWILVLTDSVLMRVKTRGVGIMVVWNEYGQRKFEP